jgi:hypothetical protein
VLTSEETGRLEQYHRDLLRYHEIELAHRYAVLKFDLAPANRDELLARYPLSERQRPKFPFDLDESQRIFPQLLTCLNELVLAEGESKPPQAINELIKALEWGVACRAHRKVLDAIRPILRRSDDVEAWEALRAERPVVAV